MGEVVPLLPEFQAVLNRIRADSEEQKRSQLALAVQLPLWAAQKRGTPNSFLRSALFASTQSKYRRFMKEQILASQNGITVKFTGEQLNQSDLDVWETIVHLAREHPLGHLCSFTAYGILKALGLKNAGKTDYAWLHSIIIRLTACVIEIIHDGQEKTYMGHLIEGGTKDHRTRRYNINLNPDLINLYGPTQWTAIDWQQRLRLRGKDLAKSLHAFYSTHAKPYPIKLATLHEITGSQNAHAPSFKRQIVNALQALTDIGFLRSFNVDQGMVTVERLRVRLT